MDSDSAEYKEKVSPKGKLAHSLVGSHIMQFHFTQDYVKSFLHRKGLRAYNKIVTITDFDCIFYKIVIL